MRLSFRVLFLSFSLCPRPAGGSFTVEIAGNRGVTSLSFNGEFATEWGDGQSHPEDYSDSNCIVSPNSEYRSLVVKHTLTAASAYSESVNGCWNCICHFLPGQFFIYSAI